jgi:hypothetical protein
MGVLHVFVPVNQFGGDEQALQWARSLPPQLKPLFEGRDEQASLPGLQ